jgi:23S rRNA C2498 (ribose-2'-O)-methylase RlmM
MSPPYQQLPVTPTVTTTQTTALSPNVSQKAIPKLKFEAQLVPTQTLRLREAVFTFVVTERLFAMLQ